MATAAAPSPTDGSLLRPVLIAWAIAGVVLTLAMAVDLYSLSFPDPDDAMRLLQVRDWLAGQSWWDVAQHRLNRGDFPMHWSRLVDLPLAAVFGPTNALFGESVATRATMIVVPLITLLAIMYLAAAITRRLAGLETARYAALLVPLSVPLVHQARPMRIDHHGWQIALALAAVALLLGRPTLRRGALAGLALATLLTISLEGLPIAATIAGIAALAWASDPARRGFLFGLVWSFFGGALALHVATRGPGMFAPACDAMAPVWLAMLGMAAAGTTLAMLAERRGTTIRIGALVAVGAATVATLLAIAPGCTAGPFATLPAIDYELWYVNVPEGRPIWEQTPYWALMTVGLPIVGLIGTVRAMRLADGAARTRWVIMLVLLAAGFALSLLVNRTGSTANALAIPGAAALMLAMLTRARAIPALGKRLGATVAALLVASPGQASAIALIAGKAFVPDEAVVIKREGWSRPPCHTVLSARAIGRLPAGIVFAPVDISPDLIATTHHRAIAGGYHRGAAPMADVLTAFTTDPDHAHRIIAASGADYVLACPGLVETDIYRRQYPRGFWARLERGERFAWLQPIRTGTPALAWRVVRPLPSTTPRP